MNRRLFLSWLGTLGPGLALARAGMGAPPPAPIAWPTTGILAWLPGRDARLVFATDRGWQVVTAVDYENGIVTIEHGWHVDQRGT